MENYLFIIDLTVEAESLEEAEAEMTKRLKGTKVLRGHYAGTVDHPEKSNIIVPSRDL